MSQPATGHLYGYDIDRNLFSQIKKAIIEHEVEDVANLLSEIINSDELAKGKAKLIPLLGDFKPDGYYYYQYSKYGRDYVPHLDNSYFTFDSSVESETEMFYKLKHIAYMLVSLDCAFIMTDLDVNTDIDRFSKVPLELDEIICAFDRNGFLEKEQILSLYHSQSLAGNGITHQVKISGYAYNKKTYDLYAKKYLEQWKYEMVFSSHTGERADFVSYMEYIKEGKDEYSRFIRDEVLKL